MLSYSESWTPGGKWARDLCRPGSAVVSPAQEGQILLERLVLVAALAQQILPGIARARFFGSLRACSSSLGTLR